MRAHPEGRPHRPGPHRTIASPASPSSRDGLQVVGATDLSVDQAGKDLGVVLGLGRKLRIKVDGNPDRFIRKTAGRRGRVVHVVVAQDDQAPGPRA